jgi:succinate dehydrogenase / fumarate reductase iron-sulfur subunit
MNLTLKVWRQRHAGERGGFVTYETRDVAAHLSLLELLDALSEQLTLRGEEPIAFDSDCREGICGACGFVVNGVAHGPRPATTVCQLHLRAFNDGDVLVLEPWRAAAFPLLKDLMVDRSALDRIVQAGGYVTAPTGAAPEANALPVAKADAERAMDAAACIGCGACVAACPNASAMLFAAAKVEHLNLLPQGQPERSQRARRLLARHDAEGFGHCSNHGECAAVCPKQIDLGFIAMLNRDLWRSALRGRAS